MSKHLYTGYLSIGYEIESDTELDYEDLLQAVANQISDNGIASGDLGDIDHYIDGKLEEEL